MDPGGRDLKNTMSTKQLTLIWYGFFLLLVLSLSGVKTSLTLSVAGVLFLLLLIYSLGPHHRANRKKVVMMIFLPMLLFGMGAFIFDGMIEYSPALSPNMLKNIGAQEVELTNTKVDHRWFTDRLSGSVKNNSAATLESLTLRMTLSSPQGIIESKNLTLTDLKIAPGQSASFQQSFGDTHLRLPQPWKWSLQVIGGIGI